MRTERAWPRPVVLGLLLAALVGTALGLWHNGALDRSVRAKGVDASLAREEADASRMDAPEIEKRPLGQENRAEKWSLPVGHTAPDVDELAEDAAMQRAVDDEQVNDSPIL